MGHVPSDEELEAAHAWEADDQIPRRPAMTAFRRSARYLLVDRSTFSSMTLEALLDADALSLRATAALRQRYLP